MSFFSPERTVVLALAVLVVRQSAEDEIDDEARVPVRLVISQPGPLVMRAEHHLGHDRPVEAVKQEVNGGLMPGGQGEQRPGRGVVPSRG